MTWSLKWPMRARPSPTRPSLGSAASDALADYILDYSDHSDYERQYVMTHLRRLVRSIELTPPGTVDDRVLEMGAYMHITPALKTRRGYGEVRGSYLGPVGGRDEKVVQSTSGEEFRCFVDLFNAEKDIYPYADGSFATVLCCELFEHLSEDPLFLLCEVNRILRPGGHIVLSTPNICSLRGVAAMLNGAHPGLYQHFWKPKPGGPDPRHAREYTPNEIRLLLELTGFTVEVLETGQSGPAEPPSFDWVVDLLRDRGFPLELRGETTHAVARKTGPVRERYPSWLYD